MLQHGEEVCGLGAFSIVRVDEAVPDDPGLVDDVGGGDGELNDAVRVMVEHVPAGIGFLYLDGKRMDAAVGFCDRVGRVGEHFKPEVVFFLGAE